MFIFDAGVDWDGHWVCEHQLATAVSRHHDVLFVEQARTLLWFLHKSGGDTPRRSKWQLYRTGMRTLSDRLNVICPPFLLPFKYLPICHQINQACRRRWLRRILIGLKWQNPVLITFDPASVGLLKAADFSCTVYYINDAHDSRGRWFNPDHLVAVREKQLTENADVIFALSEELAEKPRATGKPTYVIRNAVDLRKFRLADAAPEPSDLREIPHPRVGMVGVLDWRVNNQILKVIALHQPLWSVVLVGPIDPPAETDFAMLRSLPNVYFLGAKKPAEVPNYVRGLDVGLIPYRITEYTRQILSLKVFEYSAMGIPTVATPMPALFTYQHVVRLAEDGEQFEIAVAALLSNFGASDRARLRGFAAENTWEHRAREIMNIVARWSGRL